MSKGKREESRPLREQIKDSFKERFLEMLGSVEEYEKFIDCLLTPQRKSFRVNTLKESKPEALVKLLKEKGLSFTPVPWSKNAFFLEYEEDKRSDLGNLFEHFVGKVYVQEATSMLPPEALEIPYLEEGEDFKVLDMAAAPGSKTTQLGELMQNKGTLLANDVDYSRLSALKGNLERLGLHNVIITNTDGARIEGQKVFDRVLLDAPCSGSGVIRKSPGTLRTYNPKRLKQMQRLQLKLLKRAFELLKEGGIMTYSTCSMDPEENELCIQKFLEEHEKAELLPLTFEGLNMNTPLQTFNGEEVSKIIQENSIRVWPHLNDTNGFFLVKIRKN